MGTATQKPLTFVVNSPKELTTNLTALPKGSAQQSHFAVLAISGPQIIARTFQLKDVSAGEIKLKLQSEAVQLLSLPFNEVEFDYQILDSSPGKMSGIFLCMPRSLLREYLSIMDKTRVIPVKITTTILAIIESFCQQHIFADGRCCLLDFSTPQKVNVAIFLDKHCEFLREIEYDSPEEARTEIIQTLRSASAASKVKQFDQAYCVGNLEGKEELIAQLEKNLQTKLERGVALDVNAALAAENVSFHLNLVKPYAFSLGERKGILSFLSKSTLIAISINVLLAVVTLYMFKVNKDLRSSYKVSDYEHAKTLEQQLKSLK